MRDFIWLTWLNPLGGFDYWLFTGYKDHLIEVSETGQTKTNVFPNWPKSYGAFADTITKQTFRKTKKQRIIRSQILTSEQATEMGEQIKSSPLVQIMSGSTRRDRRTVIVDSDSITVRKEKNKVHNLSFTITYTDDYPNQHV